MNEAEILVKALNEVWPMMPQWFVFIIGVIVVSITAGAMVTVSFDLLNEVRPAGETIAILFLLAIASLIGITLMFLSIKI